MYTKLQQQQNHCQLFIESYSIGLEGISSCDTMIERTVWMKKKLQTIKDEKKGNIVYNFVNS